MDYNKIRSELFSLIPEARKKQSLLFIIKRPVFNKLITHLKSDTSGYNRNWVRSFFFSDIRSHVLNLKSESSDMAQIMGEIDKRMKTKRPN